MSSLSTKRWRRLQTGLSLEISIHLKLITSGNEIYQQNIRKALAVRFSLVYKRISTLYSAKMPGTKDTKRQPESCSHNLREKRRANAKKRRHKKLNKYSFMNHMKVDGCDYNFITNPEYLDEKYGSEKSFYIKNFIRCIHEKIDSDIRSMDDAFIDSLDPWLKSKLFLLLVTLSEQGGSDYRIDDDDDNGDDDETIDKHDADEVSGSDEPKKEDIDAAANKKSQTTKLTELFKTPTLMEQIMKENINEEFSESNYDDNYVFSSIWANFMEGLINHYLEKIIVPQSEMKVCKGLYKPMMKIISLYNEYNKLLGKGEMNVHIPSIEELEMNDEHPTAQPEGKSMTTTEKEKLIMQARQDIPKTISDELTLLSEMYSTILADEQDYQLEEFLDHAEEFIELEYLPSLVNFLFANCGSRTFWKIMIVLEPFFYYIEDIDDVEDQKEVNSVNGSPGDKSNLTNGCSDPRVSTLEKICEVAAIQQWS